MTQKTLDFTPVRQKECTFAEFTAEMSLSDLRRFTNEMVDAILALIDDCVDADVVFTPQDKGAFDSYADDAEKGIAWTLGHVIVHTTASSEEGAAIATELARGLDYRGRSRSEVPWQTMTTMAECRQRLEESRRMRLASLEMWPDQPHLSIVHKPYESIGEINATGFFVAGLLHADSHLEQIADIVRQAKAKRS